MNILRPAPTNEYGLALPPRPPGYLALEKPSRRLDNVDRHHLYWPKCLYAGHSALAAEFREHRLNSVWLLRSDHADINSRYDGVPVPPKDVMEVFMEEAGLLDTLNVTVRAIEMIDNALYEDRVLRHDKVLENRKEKLGLLEGAVERAFSLELVTNELALRTVDRALDLATAA